MTLDGALLSSEYIIEEECEMKEQNMLRFCFDCFTWRKSTRKRGVIIGLARVCISGLAGGV